ncbi:hypothetical protein HO173_005844 [Letharia columbiana]|uniref:Uncharacterized protein n=1 Tax=Letharia columbiana TaxID=112416 RepID=A0A8H6FWY0_9LECA|nr:uncharacterized protein HO173_005844 [Letharia columbiana]KAF6236214.1 hypothetical protein HO173_005844 [Letharia columbiana]
MRFSTTLPLLSFLAPLAHAAPQTHYSTVTIIPVPLSSTIIHYHPTGPPYPSGSDKPRLYNARYNASANISLSYTLSYPTTNLPPTPRIFAGPYAQPSISRNATMRPRLGDLNTTLPPLPCTLSELYCDSNTSFSLCAPAVGGGSRYVFMGAVANGTSCHDGRIEKADGGDCSPVGHLKCEGGRGFFLCDEGGLVHMGSATNETTCVDGEIEVVTLGR